MYFRGSIDFIFVIATLAGVFVRLQLCDEVIGSGIPSVPTPLCCKCLLIIQLCLCLMFNPPVFQIALTRE